MILVNKLRVINVTIKKTFQSQLIFQTIRNILLNNFFNYIDVWGSFEKLRLGFGLLLFYYVKPSSVFLKPTFILRLRFC